MFQLFADSQKFITIRGFCANPVQILRSFTVSVNANIVISLDTRRAKQDGTYPLIMRLGFDNRTIPIPLGYSFKEKDWDEKSRKVKSSYQGSESVTRLNNLIQKKKANALDIVMKLDEKGELQRLSVADIKQRIVNIGGDQSFFKYADKLIADLKEAKRFGTATSYRDVVKIVSGFVKKKDIQFSNISFDFLTRFET